jgi:hypothetical protein
MITVFVYAVLLLNIHSFKLEREKDSHLVHPGEIYNARWCSVLFLHRVWFVYGLRAVFCKLSIYHNNLLSVGIVGDCFTRVNNVVVIYCGNFSVQNRLS